jgi:hypothetical protein
MKVVLLGACSVALFAAGCGTSNSPVGAGDDSVPTTSGKSLSRPLLHLGNEGNSSSMMWLVGQGTKTSPQQPRYAVFEREQTKHEAEIASTVVADYPCSIPGSKSSDMPDLGSPVADEARILLPDVGRLEESLVAVPSPGGSVSVAVFPHGGRACVHPMDDGLILAAEVGEGNAIVFGMVDDRVRSVDVIVDGQSHRAELGENGFALTLPTAAGKDVEKLVLHHADGSKIEFPSG